jgi:hypothetical protein
MACKTCRFGVFFDGTGNSLGIDGDAKSNVAKLYESYLTGEVKENFFVGKHYEVGIGTYMTQGEYDINVIRRKIDKGYGGGGAKRIYSAIDAVCAFLDEHLYHKSEDNKFFKREIDVFGFSRGAAEARDFVNTFIKKKVITEKGDYGDVRFNFIGIFDTVGSFGEAGNDIDMKPASKDYATEVSESDGFSEHTGKELIRKKKIFLSQQEADTFAMQKQQSGWEILYNKNSTVIYAQKENVLYTPYNFHLKQGINASAKHIIHFVAHDEKRYNFPLTNIAGSGGFEYTMLGVHSDIGGGYPDSMTQELSYHISAHNTKQRAKARVQGWSERVNRHMGRVTLYKKRVVSNALSVVYWHLMYDLAVEKYGLYLQKPTEAISLELMPYFAYAKEHLTNAYTYENEPQGLSLKEKYIHYSSVDVADIETFNDGNTNVVDLWAEDSPDLIGGNDMRYVNKITGKRVDARENRTIAKEELYAKREIYENKHSLAITVKQR